MMVSAVQIWGYVFQPLWIDYTDTPHVGLCSEDDF